jgi:hypothetical protein
MPIYSWVAKKPYTHDENTEISFFDKEQNVLKRANHKEQRGSILPFIFKEP